MREIYWKVSNRTPLVYLTFTKLEKLKQLYTNFMVGVYCSTDIISVNKLYLNGFVHVNIQI